MISGNQGLPHRLETFEESCPAKVSPTAASEAALPPFEVLLKWLTYYHTQTGTWPEPGSIPATNSQNVTPTNPTQPIEKPLLKVLPGKSAGSIETIKNTPQPAVENPSSQNNLKSSVYYLAALKLAERYVSMANPLNDTAVLTLASVVAWAHYPPLAAQYTGNSLNAGPGMYLPLGKWSKELRMRKATLANGLKELEGAGLIQIETPLENKNNEKGTKRIYRLAVPFPHDLPVYDPYQPEPEENWEPQKASAEPAITRFRPVGTSNGVGTTDMNHDKNNKNYKTIKNKNHEHGFAAEPGTVEEKFLFLVEQASFPGYISPDGLTTLDKREAQKFASSPELELSSIKKVYQQTLTVWSAGKCQKNPIGFFHNSLTRYLKQISTDNGSLGSADFKTTVPDSNQYGNHTGTASPRLVPHNFDKVTDFTLRKTSSPTYNQSSKTNNSGKKYLSEKAIVSLKQETIEIEQNDYVNSESALGGFTEEVNKELIERSLQKTVLEALQNRFKSPFLADTLDQLQWQISFPGERIQVGLKNPGPGFLAISALGQSNLSLLKIALSQSLRTLGGKSLEIEIVVD